MSYLYPDIEPYHHEMLPVSDGHTLYLEEVGNPRGKPVLFIHGGPGGGVDGLSRRFFNPNKYRIILVDQRGSGKSTPFASTEGNTTELLIQDFEVIRQHLRVERWMLFGGSWGSTLALAYAQAHPDVVSELVLRGIFLASESENQWLFGGGGAHHFFPELWQDYIGFIPEDEQGDLITAYYKRLTSGDRSLREAAAYQFAKWELSISNLHYDAKAVENKLQEISLPLAVLETHYMKNHCFLKPNQLIENIYRLQNIPGFIVHGRYDVVCSPQAAWHLHQAWGGSKLYYITSGHSLAEAQMQKQLVEITDSLV